MFIPSFRRLLELLRSPPRRHPIRTRRHRASTRRPELEALEDRTLLSTVSWIGGSGDWADASHWSDGSVNRLPGPNDDAVIDVNGITVTHSTGSHTVKSLISNDAFSLSGGVLTVTGSVQEQNSNTFTNTFTLAGGTLAGATATSGTTLTVFAGTLDGVTVNGTIDMTEQQTTSLTILDGLVLNGTLSVGKTDGSTSGLVTFGNGTTANQSLSGSATVAFGPNTANSLVNRDGGGGVLTIGSNALIHGPSASIYNTSSTGMIVNRGTISVDIANGIFTFGRNQRDGTTPGILTNQGAMLATDGGALTLDGAWSNTGTISSAPNSYVYLGGTFTTAELGTVTANGGQVLLSGTLTNTGSTLALDFTSGSWNMFQGKIIGGTINLSGGAGLLLTNGASFTLDGVTVNGDLDLTEGVTGRGGILTILHSLTLNGTLSQIGDLVSFGDGTTANQTLSGAATLVRPNLTNNNGPGGVLTIASGVSMSGRGSITNTSITGTILNQGIIADDDESGTLAVGNSGGGTIINQGTIEAIDGGLVNLFNNATATFTNQGVLRVNGRGPNVPGSSIYFADGITLDQSGSFVSTPSTLLVVSDRGITGDVQNPALFNPAGETFIQSRAPTSAVPLEVMSRDLGPLSAGFTNNYAYGTLRLAAAVPVQLIDQSVNNIGNTAPEALYVDSLAVPSGQTLDLNGFHVYARTAQLTGTILNGRVTIVPFDPALSFDAPVSSNLGTAGAVDEWQFTGQAGRLATVTVAMSQAFPPVFPQLGHASVQLLDPSGNVLAMAGSTINSAGASITLGNVNLPVRVCPIRGLSWLSDSGTLVGPLSGTGD